MLFRRELAPGAAEQVALMEQDQRRRQIEQQLALHQVLCGMLSHAAALCCICCMIRINVQPFLFVVLLHQLCSCLTGVAPAATAATTTANVFCSNANAAALMRDPKGS